MAEEAKVPVVSTPVEEKHPDGAPILKGCAATAFWPSEAKALEIAKGRIKGARRAYLVKGPDGKVRYATATHMHFLMEYVLCEELKWEVTEVGKPAASKAPVTADSILAAINSLPDETTREAITKQLEAYLKAKAAKK